MRFIVVDGLDGSGKDTQASLIKNIYTEKGESVILRSHPSSDNSYGLNAKKALLKSGKLNRIRASLYYAMDVIRSVRKYNGKADTVIFVRYLMGVAYLPFPVAKLLYKFFETFLPTSQYMFFLDVEPEEALKRLQSRDDEEMFENIQDLITVRGKALKLAQDWHVIDGNSDVEEINEQIFTILNV